MSVRIWCEVCGGRGNYIRIPQTEAFSTPQININEITPCVSCSNLGYIVKGCENCKHQDLECLEAIERDSEGYRAVTFCTAWDKKDEH